MRGVLYGIGVGPGDPELLTLKAIKTINHCDIIAVPDSGAEKRTALDIVWEYVGNKPVLSLNMPMTHDEDELQKSRERAAGFICERLDAGKNVGFLTLGDPTVYSTYGYLHKMLTRRGYTAEIIPGVTSFCAAAAALGEPLCEGGEPLHIIPASYGDLDGALSLDGTKVLMKSGKKLSAAIDLIRKKKLLSKASMAERVGMDGERLVRDLNGEIGAGYFSIVIVKGESKPKPVKQAPCPRFPIFIPLAGKNVLIIGGGEVAARRVRVLRDFGAAVTVVAPEISPKLRGFLGCITWKPEHYRYIDGDFALVIAATSDRNVNRQIGADARKMGIPVSVADNGEESTFWFPAIARGNGLIAGIVSENGNHGAVKKAAERVRESLEENS